MPRIDALAGRAGALFEEKSQASRLRFSVGTFDIVGSNGWRRCETWFRFIRHLENMRQDGLTHHLAHDRLAHDRLASSACSISAHHTGKSITSVWKFAEKK